MHTLDEILSQPSIWQSALQEAEKTAPQWRAALGEDAAPLLFLGCGSTYYLSLTAAALFRKLTGRLTFALPGGEFLLQRADWLGDLPERSPKPILITVSRSGTTTETVRAAEAYRAAGGRVLTATNYPESPLATLADAALLLPQGQEESVAQTRSFSSMLVGLNALAILLGEQRALWQAIQRLPEAAAGLIERYAPLARQLGEDLSLERFYFLGSGVRYGLASEASLKMKEMSLSHSEPFPFLEFRHGPMSMVNGQTLLIGLLSEQAQAQEQKVLDEMQALGGQILSLGEQGARVEFASGIPEEGCAVLYLPILQLLACYRSLAKGLNPDRPHNLTAVVQLNF
ncbi:MAG: SIS domain-containing protein [Chloroflexi bacterium]|jgi:glucosamine--fructose-6-phosphate aminotransferase (isomerizing)|uniref:SIS domain-containing protein n=1 Tax=Candidatus Roseilinea sp. NK_OTU-006 TaxID=2704250 RepID=UPI000F1FCEFA|nr:SIS domain-containing protein [Candidatus Roseilinea sp. NK_OTU-006]RMG65835.1 MAG: SIS domain-containing protein [Chloroflexota bacterium]